MGRQHDGSSFRKRGKNDDDLYEISAVSADMFEDAIDSVIASACATQPVDLPETSAQHDSSDFASELNEAVIHSFEKMS